MLSLENKFRGDEIVLEVFKQELILRQKIYEDVKFVHILSYSLSLVQALVDSNFFVTSKIFKKWMEILF